MKMINPKIVESWLILDQCEIKGYLFILECRENGIRKGFHYDFQTEEGSEQVSADFFPELEIARDAAKKQALGTYPKASFYPVLFLEEGASIGQALVIAKMASASDYKELIEAGKVAVNGAILTNTDFDFQGPAAFDISTSSGFFRVLIS